MTTIKSDLPDQQAAALQAEAAVQGPSVEVLVRKLAEHEAALAAEARPRSRHARAGGRLHSRDRDVHQAHP